MQWTAPIERQREALEMRRVNVSLWLQTEVRTMLPPRLLYPQQRTFLVVSPKVRS